MTFITIGFLGVLLTALIARGAETSPPRLEPQAMPSYAGFDQINPTKNHFIIVGDTQSTSRWEFWRERNDKERKLIIDEITKREPAFVIHLGDLTTRGSSSKHWQQFDESHKELRAKKIPYFPVLGNHEFYGHDERALQNYFGRFPHLSGRHWYSFTWKNIGFILLNSNFSRLAAEESEKQKKWYTEQLEKIKEDQRINHIIVCCHEPAFTHSRVVGPNEKVKEFFADPFLECGKASLFFSGHSHSFECFQLRGKLFVVSGGGGGPRHKLSAGPENPLYKDLFKGRERPSFHFIEIEAIGGIPTYKIVYLTSDGTFMTADLIPR